METPKSSVFDSTIEEIANYVECFLYIHKEITTKGDQLYALAKLKGIFAPRSERRAKIVDGYNRFTIDFLEMAKKKQIDVKYLTDLIIKEIDPTFKRYEDSFIPKINGKSDPNGSHSSADGIEVMEKDQINSEELISTKSDYDPLRCFTRGDEMGKYVGFWMDKYPESADSGSEPAPQLLDKLRAIFSPDYPEREEIAIMDNRLTSAFRRKIGKKRLSYLKRLLLWIDKNKYANVIWKYDDW